jgi:hypothetical protein
VNTSAHLIVGAAAFAKPEDRRITGFALLGALLPDLSLYVLAGAALFVFGLAPGHVFGTLYFSPTWQTIFAIDNSFLIWGAALALGIWKKLIGLIALSGAAFLHLLLDFPLHHDDGRPHFWPVTDWVFQSPVSYWDSDHHAMWIAPLEAAAVTILAFLVFRRFQAWPMRAGVAALLAAEYWIVRQWLWFF